MSSSWGAVTNAAWIERVLACGRRMAVTAMRADRQGGRERAAVSAAAACTRSSCAVVVSNIENETPLTEPSPENRCEDSAELDTMPRMEKAATTLRARW